MTNPEYDLSAHADVLGDPADYFVSSEGRIKPLVVRHEDGIPVAYLEEDGSLTPYEPPAAAHDVKVTGELDHQAGPSKFSG